MEKLTICVWHWGKKYPEFYIDRLFAGLRRHLKQPFETHVLAPREEDVYLTKVPGCFCRLRMFDPEFQQSVGLEGRIVSIDLDAIVTGPLDELFDRPESFVILRGGNASNPCPFNGSMFMLRAGEYSDVWRDFSLKNASQIPCFEFPDDQGWLAHKVPKAAGWTVGAESGVYCFQKPGWPSGEALPGNARLVAFPGWRDPSRFEQLAWVKDNWRE